MDADVPPSGVQKQRGPGHPVRGQMRQPKRSDATATTMEGARDIMARALGRRGSLRRALLLQSDVGRDLRRGDRSLPLETVARVAVFRPAESRAVVGLD